ncbi:MAG: SDR family NAD(P)-dependent oxidoreductase [Pseudomonadota bacterium]
MPTPASESGFLRGRTACVTGGLSGIGLATAKALATEGARVAVGSRRAQAADWEAAPAVAPLDLRDSAVIGRFVAATEAALGPVDILVNAAGVTCEQGVVGHSDALWSDILETNLTGAFRMTRACLPGMIERGWGRVINIGSTAATVGWKDNPAYCASKAGLLGLTRCVALEGAPHGVACTMISPTWVETDMLRNDAAEIAAREGQGRSAAEVIAEIKATNPQQRIIQAEEIAATAVFLCQDAAFGLSMDNIQITGGALW